MTNPYKTPDAPVLTARELKVGSIWKAVLAGFAVDWVGTLLVAMLVAFVYGIFLAAAGMSEEQITAALSFTDPTAPVYLFIYALGILVSWYAATLCCRIAGLEARRAVIVLAVVTVPFSLMIAVWTAEPMMESIIGTLLSLGAYYFAYRGFVKAHPGAFPAAGEY